MTTDVSRVLLPNGMQHFENANGTPLAAGTVYMYVPGTTTNKTTWVDHDLTVPNSNPINLDANGDCIIWGTGTYRQVVYDALGNLIWDQLTGSGDVPDATAISVAYDLPVFMQGKPSDGEVYPVFNIVRAVSLPIGLAGSVFTIGTNPTVSSTWTFKKNGVEIGHVIFDSSGIPTITFVAEITFAALDQFTLTGQNPADATGANFACTIVFTLL